MGVFDKTENPALARDDAKVMTLGGTVTATGILLAIVASVAILVYTPLAKAMTSAAAGGTYSIPGWIWPAFIGSMIGGIGFSLIIFFKPKTAPVVAPLHAVVEGVFVGIASFVIPMQFLGAGSVTIVMQALLATFGIAAAMLFGYATGVLRVGPLVQKIIVTALMGLVLYVMALWILGMIGINMWNGYADTGIMGIGFTGFCIAIASLFLLLDFQFIEKGIEARAPKHMEWVGAWGLMVTLVWLYIELLRLFAKLQSRD